MAVLLQEKLSQNISDPSSIWIVTMINTSMVLCANFFWIAPKLYTLFENAWETLDAFIYQCVQPMAEKYKICLPEDSLKARIQIHTNRIIFKGPRFPYIQTTLQHIDYLERFIASNPVSTQSESTNSKLGWASDISAMRLYITAVGGSVVCSNDQQLRESVDQWKSCNTRFLGSLDKSMPHMETLLPMTQLNMMSGLGIAMYYLPLLCIVHDLESFEEIADVYNSLNVIMDQDVAKRIQRMIEMVRMRKKTWDCTLQVEGRCSSRHDGLDVLRHPEGVLC